MCGFKLAYVSYSGMLSACSVTHYFFLYLAETLENAPDLASPCCASKEKSCFKENININKSGASNLCLEPQQMKKRKKGGKYNLRKSLAWDRAFSTEEGEQFYYVSFQFCTEYDSYSYIIRYCCIH